MIKVVGNDSSVVKQVTCKQCGSILEYMPCDVEAGETIDWRGDMDIYQRWCVKPCSLGQGYKH